MTDILKVCKHWLQNLNLLALRIHSMAFCVPLGCSTWWVHPLFNIGEWFFPGFIGAWDDNRRHSCHTCFYFQCNKQRKLFWWMSLFCCRELFKVKLNMLIGIFAHNYLKDKTEGFAGTFWLCFNCCTCVPVLHHYYFDHLTCIFITINWCPRCSLGAIIYQHSSAHTVSTVEMDFGCEKKIHVWSTTQSWPPSFSGLFDFINQMFTFKFY